MNIIMGKLKGMRLATPSKGTRPTVARVREAVFNILAPDIEGAVFWDLFAGSGAMGLTAISLGAAECVWVESGRAALTALKKNIAEAKKRLGNGERRFNTLNLELAKAWPSLLSMTSPQIVWADPPYDDSERWAGFLKRELFPLANDQTCLIMEFQSKALQKAEDRFFLDEHWETVKTRKYGGTSIIIWRKRNERPTP
ncbi:MAG: RsmD family RNA methyltransferase [Deltaproteobacteria bacterium]|nr:RsmD family RNA methyltransferase [Deltaproteobacteria bacterium]